MNGLILKLIASSLMIGVLAGCGGGGTNTVLPESQTATGVQTTTDNSSTATNSTSSATTNQTNNTVSNTNNNATSNTVSNTNSNNNSSTPSNSTKSAISLGLSEKLGYNYHEYYNYVYLNNAKNIDAAKTMLASGVKWVRVFRDVAWGSNAAEDNALLTFLKTFKDGGGKVIFTVGWQFDGYNNLAFDSNQRNQIADLIMNGPRGVKYTLKKYQGYIDALELGNEYQLHGNWNANDVNSPNSGVAYARLMNVVVPQIIALDPDLPLYPSSSVENAQISLTQGAQFVVDLYNNATPQVKAAWAGPNLHIYDHRDTKATGILNKFKTLSSIIDQAWPNAKYIISEVGITTANKGQYAGATVYSNTMQRDIMVDIAKAWATNPKVKFWNFYEWQDRDANDADGEHNFGVMNHDLKPKAVTNGKVLNAVWATL